MMRDIVEMLVIVNLQHIIHEVNIPEVVAGLDIFEILQTFHNILNHLRPVVVFNWDDDLINVKKNNVVIPSH